MLGFWLFRITIAIVICATHPALSEDTISVITTYGEVVGRHVKVSIPSETTPRDAYVQTFEGIPFAKPPIGELRFRPPVEPTPWVGKVEALKPASSCIQLIPDFIDPNGTSTSEDCLYLNVWVPLPLQKNAPVMVWIYGGGFSMGSTTPYNYQTFAATEGVIVVSMSYRVNSLGFLYLDSEECPGNMGLMDQQLALKWVKHNIDRFGGDPNKVTIFGHSAGAVSTSLHLFNRNGQDLFNRVIVQSGPAGAPWASDKREKALAKGLKVAEVVGCGDNILNKKSILECLRSVDAKLLASASATMGDIFTMYHRPVVDDKIVFDNPATTVNDIKNKEVMFGVTSDDTAFLVTLMMKQRKISPEDIFKEFAKSYLEDPNDDVLKSVKYYYKDHCNTIKEYAEEKSTLRFGTDINFVCPTVEVVDMLGKAGVKTFLFQWNYRPLSSQLPVWVRADHGDELGFVMGENLQNDAEVALSKRTMRYWGSFAKYGDPNIENIPTTGEIGNFTEFIESWPVYTFENKGRLDIDLYQSFAAYGDFREEQCRFWKHDYSLIWGKFT